MPLADDSEPLRLADGRMVYPGGRVEQPRTIPPNLIEVPTHKEAQQLVVNTRRKLADLPDVPRTMNAVSVVLSYTLFGLDEQEVALAINGTEAQVKRIKESAAYQDMHETVVRSILDAETDVIRDIFKQHSRRAANVLVESLHNGTRTEQMFAAKDFLDRAGHRPADIVEHRHQMDGGLTIEIVRKDENDKPPLIDIEVE